MNKKYPFFLIILILGLIPGVAQDTLSNFQEDALSLQFLEDVRSARYLDFQQDGHMDLVYSGKNAQDEPLTLIYFNGDAGFSVTPDHEIAFYSRYILFKDLNNDGQGDLILYGTDVDESFQLRIYQGNEDGNLVPLEFEPEIPSNGALSVFDLDNDGLKEIIISGNLKGEVNAYLYASIENEFELTHTLPGIENGAMVVLDSDNDGLNDILLNGQDSTGQTNSFLLSNQGALEFVIEEGLINPLSEGTLSIGDVNHDGKMDVLSTGIDFEGTNKTYLNILVSDRFEASYEFPGVKGGSSILAEFNGNGLTDVFYSGYDSLDRPRTYVYELDKENPFLIGTDTINYYTEFGDVTQDGNLDLLRVSENELTYYFNSLPLNSGPTITNFYLPVGDGERILFSWTPATDEHTPDSAITYDFAIQVEQDSFLVSPANSVERHRYRYVSEHGYMLNDTTFAFEGELNGRYGFVVWGVDNHLNSGGGCRGVLIGGQIVNSCLEAFSEDTVVCSGQVIDLTIGDMEFISWLNAEGQELSRENVFSYQVFQDEKLYAIGYDGSCLQYYFIDIVINDDVLPVNVFQGCVGSVLDYSLPPEKWSSALWVSAQNGVVSTSLDLEYILSVPDTIRVTATDLNGCSISDMFTIDIFPDFVTSITESQSIFVGQSTQLQATGGVSYEWSPAAGLSSPSESATGASPSQTTTYTVEITAANGCVQTEQVTVEVKGSVFVPELFTPNADGRNDVFKIYGSPITDIQFTILDREGNKLFESSDPGILFNQGWDGVALGKEVPNGTYVWTVSGQFSDGTPVTMQGKRSGSIKLVR